MDEMIKQQQVKIEIKEVVFSSKHRHYCGYVTFPSRFLTERGYDGFLTYVPVHGGITYAEQEDDGPMTYGFDCAHLGDDEDPKVRDMDWLTAECKRMAVGLIMAAEYEKRYLLAVTGEEKAAVIDEYHDALKPFGMVFNVTDNFGSMINLLFGRL